MRVAITGEVSPSRWGKIYLECTPLLDKCLTCRIRFRCYTHKEFDNCGGYVRGRDDCLQPREFMEFMNKSNE